MSPSPNPWDLESNELPDVSRRGSERILDNIRYFLRRWPGKISSMLDEQERHSRLVRVIAGYPEILQGVTPLDAPFEVDSRRSFEMVLAIDNRRSNIGSSSLWTELLEIDSRFPEGEERRTEQLLAALFLGLKEDPPVNKKAKPKLSRAAQSLLAELFSYTKLGDWRKVCNFMREPSGSMKPNPKREFSIVMCEYKRIKNWMHEINQHPDRNPSLSQRYLRGGSSLLQVGMAMMRGSRGFQIDFGERRDVRPRPWSDSWGNITSLKNSNILIDGGGRLAVRLSNSMPDGVRTGNFTLGRALLEELYSLDIDDFVTDTGGEQAGLNFPLIESYSYNQSNIGVIPQYSIDSFTHFCEEMESEVIPGKRLIPPWSESCPRCNPELPISKKEEDRIAKDEGGFCEGHRLLHLIGHRQRIRDSAQNQPDYVENKPDMEFPPTERSVKAIATIDGNSIGWLLNSSRFDEVPELVIDGIRRRSMRFNAHWWIALSKAIAQQNEQVPDSIACWVSAGDDIVLAAYGATDEDGLDSVESLKEMLREFSQNLNKRLNIDLGANPNGPLATFCASISHRLDGGINGMISKGSDLEVAAKNQWRVSHRDDPGGRTMISAEKLKMESFDIHRMLLEGTEWTESLLGEVAERHSLDVNDSDDLQKLHVICSRAEIVYFKGEKRILISEKKEAVGSLPNYEKLELPSTETGIINLVLIQSQ